LTLNDLGDIARTLAHPDKARRHYENSLAIQRRIGHRQAEAATLTKPGDSLIDCRALPEAEAVLQEAAAARHAPANPEPTLELQAALARLHLEKGEVEPALGQAVAMLESLAGVEAPLPVYLSVYCASGWFSASPHPHSRPR
jgi:hypothetical protein